MTEQTQSIRRDLLTRLTAWLAEQVPRETLEELARHHIDRLSELLEEYMIHMYVSGHNRRSAAENPQCGDPTVWLGEILSCSAVGRSAHLGKPRTSDPSSSNSTSSTSCMCGYCSILEVGAFCSPVAFGVLCFIETIRAYHATQKRHFDPGRPSGNGCSLHTDRVAGRQEIKLPETSTFEWTKPMSFMWVTQILTLVPMWSRIWSGSLSSFKLRFDHIQRHLLQSKPFLPSSLRPGGATFLFRLWDENLPRLQWRGRWRSFRMLEIYVQELGAAEVWIRFPPKIRAKVFLFGILVFSVANCKSSACGWSRMFV